MRYTFSDKLIAYLTLFSGLTISAVAIWYSVAGLVAIFAAAAIPIIIMGVVLEISKLIATIWLKVNWNRAPVFIRTYLMIAVAILMLITSMGIFGFLSKAHSDNSLISGDIQAKIAVYDEKISTAKGNIDANRKALKQMDEAVDQVMGRSQDEKGADKAVALRRGQAKERTRLLSEITAEQKVIAQLSEERAPIAAEVRKVEAEVGPIKYIANFIYGDNPDANILEKAVTWVIIIIVIVFDPLAVILLLASQYSFQWFRQARDEDSTNAEGDSLTTESDQNIVEETTVTEKQEPTINIPDPEPKLSVDPHPPGWMYTAPLSEVVEAAKTQPAEIEQLVEIEQPAEKKDTELLVESRRLTEEELDELDQDDEWKEAKHAWKEANPNETLKRQKELYLSGTIDDLPWAEDVKKKKYIVKENAVQIQKTTKE
jgi:hypothetical protein